MGATQVATLDHPHLRAASGSAWELVLARQLACRVAHAHLPVGSERQAARSPFPPSPPARRRAVDAWC
ncbi:MAG TPA: hypothetical protein VM324_02930 [Egibacteraceae bacterium]|nr:hypothetical protein [Egibacteraceae bacterium]